MKTSKVALLLASLLCSVTAQAANAQYYNNYFGGGAFPYYLGSSLIYPLTRMFGPPVYNYNALNPYYLTNRAANAVINTSGLYRAPGYGNNPVGWPNPIPGSQQVGMQEYTEEEPLNAPRKRVRPSRNGKTSDMNSSAGWYNSQGQLANQARSGQPTATPATGAAAPGTPPVAPQRALTGGNALANAAEAPLSMVPGSVHSPAPLAQGFVNMVNSKFDGDISKTLFNADGRSWAHAVGLVNNNEIFGADLSQERVLVISKIMKDPALDSVSKIDAAKILLRNSSASPTVAGTQ